MRLIDTRIRKFTWLYIFIHKGPNQRNNPIVCTNACRATLEINKGQWQYEENNISGYRA